jgi:MoxR-like ATPase
MTKLPPPSHPDALRLPDIGLTGRDGKPYLADPGLRAAAGVALALELPLLLTGEPGCGKTDFAWVIAHFLDALSDAAPAGGPPGGAAPSGDPAGRGPLACYVRTDTRARDLLYSYDALVRFGDAQHGDEAGLARARDARRYVTLEPLGLALMSPRRRVVLIDEIDKAPRDLPNDLLRELETGEFDIPEIPAELPAGAPAEVTYQGVPLGRHMRRPAGAPRPVVIITSNVERQLPEPFLRRCVFYHIDFPGTGRLVEIVEKRFPDLDQPYLARLVRVFEGARLVPNLIKRASTAELLDWIGALTRAFAPDSARREVEAFAAAMKPDGRLEGELRWTDLPAAGCLFKLYEDLQSAAEHAAT